MSGCACGLVQAYLKAKHAGAVHAPADMRTWGPKDLDAHMDAEEREVFPVIRRQFPDRGPDVDALEAVHRAWRTKTARGQMPSRAALLAHAMIEDRLLRETGLVAASP